MELTLKHWILFATLLLTALSAGLFYAWEVSVIPGTRKLNDTAYLQSMQSINRAILNPGFYLIFFGSLVMLVLNTYQQYQPGWSIELVLMVLALGFYLAGTFGITVMGNVPLNEALDKVELTALDGEALRQHRDYYEQRWNTLHTWRTVCSLMALVSLQLGAFIHLIKS